MRAFRPGPSAGSRGRCADVTGFQMRRTSGAVLAVAAVLNLAAASCAHGPVAQQSGVPSASRLSSAPGD